MKPAIFTLCVGNAWGEAALLLAAGAKGNRSALPSSTIMMKQVTTALNLTFITHRGIHCLGFFPDNNQLDLSEADFKHL